MNMNYRHHRLAIQLFIQFINRYHQVQHVMTKDIRVVRMYLKIIYLSKQPFSQLINYSNSIVYMIFILINRSHHYHPTIYPLEIIQSVCLLMFHSYDFCVHVFVLILIYILRNVLIFFEKKRNRSINIKCNVIK